MPIHIYNSFKWLHNVPYLFNLCSFPFCKLCTYSFPYWCFCFWVKGYNLLNFYSYYQIECSDKAHQ